MNLKVDDGCCPVCKIEMLNYEDISDWIFVGDEFVCQSCFAKLVLCGDDGYDYESNEENPRFWYKPFTHLGD
jgi:hypothetical protein